MNDFIVQILTSFIITVVAILVFELVFISNYGKSLFFDYYQSPESTICHDKHRVGDAGIDFYKIELPAPIKIKFLNLKKFYSLAILLSIASISTFILVNFFWVEKTLEKGIFTFLSIYGFLFSIYIFHKLTKNEPAR